VEEKEREEMVWKRKKERKWCGRERKRGYGVEEKEREEMVWKRKKERKC